MKAFMLLYDVLFVLVFCVVYGAATYAGVGVVQALGGSPWLAPIGVLAGLVTVVGVTSALHMLVPRPPNGAHKVGSPSFICWGLRFLIQRQLCLFPTKQLIHYIGVLRFLTYRSLGSRIAFDTSISSDAVILDWDRLRTGSGVVLGTEVRVYSHYLDRGKLILGDVHLDDGALLTALVCVGPFVRIGKGARVDPEARIGPRVTIEAGARVGPRAVVREDSVVRAGARVPEQAWIDKNSVIEADAPTHKPTSSAAWSSAGAVLLALGLGLLTGCEDWREPAPLPEPTAAPTLAITSPTDGATVTTAADGARSVLIDFTTEGVTLEAPGTCLATDSPCGHVRVTVDGDACNAAGDAFNSVAVASPAQAGLARCAAATGAHTIRLALAQDDGAPWLDGGGSEIAASLTVTADIPPLLERLGGEAGIAALADAMVARQLSDPRINAYFRNASIDHENMAVCMATKFEEVAKGSEGGDTDCQMDMAAVHAGLGVSTVDFDDWMENLSGALAGLGIAEADAAEFVALLMPEGDAIIEDPDNDGTLYQRLGRREGLEHVAFHFTNKILMDPELARYFLDENSLPDYSPTFGVCLVRLLGSLDGPFIYGEGFPLEPQLADEGRACRGMSQTHENMTSAPPDAAPVSVVEFLRVGSALVDALLYLQVPQEEIDLLLEAMNLPALCNQIIADPTECAALL